jgi:hypothetical protein
MRDTLGTLLPSRHYGGKLLVFPAAGKICRARTITISGEAIPFSSYAATAIAPTIAAIPKWGQEGSG